MLPDERTLCLLSLGRLNSWTKQKLIYAATEEKPDLERETTQKDSTAAKNINSRVPFSKTEKNIQLCSYLKKQISKHASIKVGAISVLF
jgi:hypothetical protein